MRRIVNRTTPVLEKPEVLSAEARANAMIAAANRAIAKFNRLHERSLKAFKRAKEAKRIADWSHERAFKALMRAKKARWAVINALGSDVRILLDRPATELEGS